MEFVYTSIIFIFALSLSSFLFKRYINIANKYNLIKGSNERSSHSGKVFTGAGILLAFILLLAGLVLNTVTEFDFESISPVLATSILISILGFYDDFQELSAFHKYTTLTFLIAMVLYSESFGSYNIIINLNGFLGFYEIPYLYGFIFTTFVYLSIINAINLMDGIDSYLAVFSCLSFLIFGVIFYYKPFINLSLVCLVLSAGLVIFLRYNNSKKKKIFVGDAGSLFIGFWLSYFSIIFLNAIDNSFVAESLTIKAENTPVLAVALLNMPILDTMRVMLIRISNKKSPFIADKNHIHHIFLSLRFSHINTAVVLCLIHLFNLAVIYTLESYLYSLQLTLAYVSLNLVWFGIFQLLSKRVVN
jgi:UDP-N-acetylmuramyl pentapeptide phosphotransferase/UDP-N-acetylglucosamine-1-phosphate transferase